MREGVVFQLCAEEEALVAVMAVIGTRTQAVLHHVLLEPRRGSEHRRTHVAGEAPAALEGVLDEVALETQRSVEGGAAEMTLVHGALV